MKARGRIVFIAAILTAFGLILGIERVSHDARAAGDATDAVVLTSGRGALAPQRELAPGELAWARIAWRYFEINTDPTTGLVNSADKFPSTTMWDTGSHLLALISAHRLGLIDTADFDARTAKALGSLARLPLFDAALPNKAYNTQTLQMVDYDNNPTVRGLGWSALDVARLTVPLEILMRDYIQHAPAARAVMARWDTSRLTRDGVLYGAVVENGATVLKQEGRVGYEEYAAKALIHAGFDAFQAFRTDDNAKLSKVEGVPIPVDDRTSKKFGAQVYATSEPYLLDGLEFGFDTRSRAYSDQLFLAEQRRYERTGILTAVSEGHLDKAPFFVYATVQANGRDWSVITDKGERRDDLRTLSTKTAFALDALYGVPYSMKLVQSVVGLNDGQKGWLEGRYEKDGKANAALTANTNAVVLESLAYRVSGPLARSARR